MPLSASNLVILLVLALLLVGPERLPEYARQLAQLARALRHLAADGAQRVREDLGPELDGLDLRTLDPRTYDPRRIVRDVFSEEAGRSAPAREAASPTPPQEADEPQPPSPGA